MDTKKYWEQRAKNIRKYKGEEFYTITELPFYIYRRNQTLEILDGFNVKGKRILEIGCGDGYYSRYLKKRGAEVVGVDISNNMINLAKKNAKKENLDIPFYKIEGEHLEFEDKFFDFDIVLTVTVLQHILDENILNHLLSEVSRVLVGGGGQMIIFERVTTRTRKGPTWIVRKTNEYINMLKEHNLTLDFHFVISSPFYRIMIFPSNVITRRLPIMHQIESIYSEVLVMITKYLDKIWKDKTGLGYFLFRNEKIE